MDEGWNKSVNSPKTLAMMEIDSRQMEWNDGNSCNQMELELFVDFSLLLLLHYSPNKPFITPLISLIVWRVADGLDAVVAGRAVDCAIPAESRRL